MKLHLSLIAILAIAFFLRVFALDILPSGFTPDEASFGYDAYSLLLTGKDQWGHPFPLVLESFGDFKTPLYSYLTIPSVGILGLNKFATRLPNAFFGTLAVFATFLLVKELFKGSSNKNLRPTTYNLQLGIIAAFLLAISPWHIMMSRGAFEANLTTFFLPASAYLFLKGLEGKKTLFLSALGFGLNLFSYHSARLVTPLLVLLLIFLYRDRLFQKGKKDLALSGLIFSLFLLLAISTLFYGSGRRAKDISIFNGALEEASEQRTVALSQGLDPFLARLLHNKYQVLVTRFLANYSQYTSYKFLFLDGPAEATYGMIPGRGVLYLFELPFIFGFIYALFKFKRKRTLMFIFFWILIAPIPAALTTGRGYAANRAVVMLPALTIALGLGAATIFAFLQEKLGKGVFKFFLFCYILISLPFFAAFVIDYFYLSPYKTSGEMLYGDLEAAYWLAKYSSDKTEIVVSKSLSEPHIYIAFANSWDPNEYQTTTKDWRRYRVQNLTFLDQLYQYSLGRYVFQAIDEEALQSDKDTLLVGKPQEFPEGLNFVKRFNYPDGKPAVLIAEPYGQLYAKKIF